MSANMVLDWLGLNALAGKRDKSKQASQGQASWRARAAFSKQLDTFYTDYANQLQHSNATDRQILRAMADIAEGRKAPIASVYRDLEATVGHGIDLAEALRPYVPATHILHIHTGQATRSLRKGLEEARFAMRQSQKLKTLARSSLLGPTAQLLLLLLVSFGLFGGFVIPEFIATKTFTPNAWLHFLVAGADFFKAHYLAVPLALLALGRLGFASMPRATGSIRQALDQLFPWSAYRLFAAGEFFLQLSPLLANNVVLGQALRRIQAQSSPYVAEHCQRMAERAIAGQSGAETFDTGLIPPGMVDRLRLYEATGQLNHILLEAGRSSFDDTLELVRRSTERTAALLRIVTYILLIALLGSMFSMVDLTALTNGFSGKT